MHQRFCTSSSHHVPQESCSGKSFRLLCTSSRTSKREARECETSSENKCCRFNAAVQDAERRLGNSMVSFSSSPVNDQHVSFLIAPRLHPLFCLSDKHAINPMSLKVSPSSASQDSFDASLPVVYWQRHINQNVDLQMSPSSSEDSFDASPPVLNLQMTIMWYLKL